MMILNVSEAKARAGEPVSFSFASDAESIGALSDTFSFEGEVLVKGTITYTGIAFRLEGSISCTKSFDCDRCLEHTIQQQELDFCENFKQGAEPEPSGEQSEDVNYFDGDTVDILDLVRDNMLAAQPLNNICNADCRGLCLKCGANLNHGDCGCDRFVVDPRLAALQQLLEKK
ncbi:MAG: YceD family protein [Selenomonadaceae bacterium]